MKSSPSYSESKDFSLNDQWYYIALLDLTTCSNFRSSPSWIARRLGISEEEVLLTIERLHKAGFLKFEDGKLQKVHNHLIIPTLVSREKIRQYHKTMSQKAMEVMERNVSVEDFQRRLIKGSTIAANPAQLEKAKAIMNKAIDDVIETLTEGDCTEIYHFNLQLFPLLKQNGEK